MLNKGNLNLCTKKSQIIFFNKAGKAIKIKTKDVPANCYCAFREIFGAHFSLIPKSNTLF